MPRYLSPSSLSAWREDRDQYVLRYLCADIPKISQTAAMAVGSSFDAYVKDGLNKVMFGRSSEFDTLFESQVEPHNRVQARLDGAVCYKAYRSNGAFDSLIQLLQRSENIQILFEKKEEGVSIGLGDASCVLLGYADLTFQYKGIPCILDWKVNGFMSKFGASPKQGHMEHKDCLIGYHHDLMINEDNYLERVEPSWATQLSTYAWLGGMPIGGEFIGLIDQLACRPTGIKVAKHRCRISEGFQKTEFLDYCKVWETVTSDHVYRELSVEESRERVKRLADQASVFNNQEDKYQWLKNALRG